MPRKSLTGSNESKVVKFRVDKEVENIITGLKDENINVSKFIRESIKSNSIAKKLTLFFIDSKVAPHIPNERKKEFLNSLTPQEKETIDSLIGGSA